MSGLLSMFTPTRLTTATSSISFECLYMWRYGLANDSVPILLLFLRAIRETYRRRTNHRLSHVFLFASTSVMRWPFFVGPSLMIKLSIRNAYKQYQVQWHVLAGHDLRLRHQLQRDIHRLHARCPTERRDARLLRLGRFLAQNNLRTYGTLLAPP
jgi:hypothetical protein